ncbi:MAG: hypothetical protein A2Y40_10770 [Candidatus Margulisbacteria bacterium GWF2_35_9]|nr:MAG: hypothetical protein A2Y40_10770 [Candidatus Margulisbacteria bacterium GWF2_35_9]
MKKLIFIFIIIMSLASADINYADHTRFLNKQDVVSYIQDIQLQLSKSPNAELNKLSHNLADFINEFYSYRADIIVLPQKNMQDKIGLYQPVKNTIYVKSDISVEALMTTLVHELTHYKQIKNQESTASDELSYEDEAHQNALVYYSEFINELDYNDPELEQADNGWKRTLTGYSFACKNNSQKEYLSAIY